MSKSNRTEKIVSEICARLAEGETLRSICRRKGMPHWNTVYVWMAEDQDLAGRIARAREIGFDAIAQEALEIANTPVIGEETEESDDGRIKTKRGDMLGHRKLQIDTRLKLLAKWCPARYGDKTSMELTGANGGPVRAQVIIATGVPSDDPAQ